MKRPLASLSFLVALIVFDANAQMHNIKLNLFSLPMVNISAAYELSFHKNFSAELGLNVFPR